MSKVDRSEAKDRLDILFAESKANNEGAGIPEIVGAVLGDDADEEIAELVMMAMEDSGRTTTEEILDGILTLPNWRLDQT